MKKSGRVLFLFIIVVFFMQACGSATSSLPEATEIPVPIDPIQEHLDKAAEYAESGDIRGEITEYLAAIDLDSENALIHLLLGKTYERVEMVEGAVTEYKEAARLAALDPELTISIPSVAHLYYDSGEYEKAIPEFIEVIEANPDNLEDYISLGYCYYQLGEYEEAAARYELLLERAPEYPIALFGLGSIYYYKLSEYEKALSLLQKYLEIEPETEYREEVETIIADITGVEATLFEGDTNAGAILKDDVLNAALNYLECDRASVVKVKVNFFELEDGTEEQLWGEEEWLITACEESRLFSITFTADGEGGTFFDIAEIDIPTDASGLSVEEHLDLASEYYDAGETDKEIAEYLAALEIDPDNLQAHTFLGFTYHVEKGKTEEGIAELEKALAIAPEDASALMFLGFIYYDLQEFDKAIPIFEEFLELHSDHQYRDMIGEMLNESKNQ
ncbi:MAG: tetratricopeptide repeat protein [Anaerolineae bacterium]|mgnify:CR=1 FL=1|nr:tetratricopeptide repeat protein [Anaerolineae bacterium]MBT7075065.1 tetratricopeptide repeat protein [Anaerolineae bacterium]MBT7781963.1 tetratricopeptide repeat protein [Anaerolineae bacterium]